MQRADLGFNVFYLILKQNTSLTFVLQKNYSAHLFHLLTLFAKKLLTPLGLCRSSISIQTAETTVFKEEIIFHIFV